MKASILTTLTLAYAGLAASQSTTTTTAASATITGVPKPSPTQDGLIGSCTSFYKAVLGDTCIGIVNKNNGAFTLAQFYAWNPAVGNDCLGLWANTYYCVGVAGTSTTTLSTSTSSSTTQGNGIATPVPIQPGMVGNCDMFYFVKKDDTCRKIAQYYGVQESDLIRWNPSVEPDCRGLWADVNVCVRTVGYTYLMTLSCSSATETKTWGDNKSAALESVLQWCRSGAPGMYAIDQKKSICVNAPLGQNKFNFEITNKSGRSQGLLPSVCETLTIQPIGRCTRGGSALYRSFEIKATVTAGRC